MSSTHFSDVNSDVAQLRARLNKAIVKNDKVKYREIIQKIVTFMALGFDVASLFPDVMKACATNDMVQKKLAYMYICHFAESNKDLAILAVNTLVKDTAHENPMIRGLALRSMLNLRITNLVTYMQEPLMKGLRDRHAYVRRNAVIGCVKLFHIHPDIFTELGALEKLQAMIFDGDLQVSFSILIALDEILEGGFVFERNMVAYLTERLSRYDEWDQCQIMQMLTRYVTFDQEEILLYLNVLDDRLKHSNHAVVMAGITLFLTFTKEMDHITQDVFQRVRVSIIGILPSAIPEMMWSILQHVIVLVEMKPRLFHDDFKLFYLRNNDPSYILVQKFNLLVSLTTEGNHKEIIKELR